MGFLNGLRFTSLEYGAASNYAPTRSLLVNCDISRRACRKPAAKLRGSPSNSRFGERSVGRPRPTHSPQRLFCDDLIMTDQISPGSIVRLKSGGPSMTVESIDALGAVHCVWFQSSKGQLSTRAFVATALELVPSKAVTIHRRHEAVSGTTG